MRSDARATRSLESGLGRESVAATDIALTFSDLAAARCSESVTDVKLREKSHGEPLSAKKDFGFCFAGVLWNLRCEKTAQYSRRTFIFGGPPIRPL